MRKIQFPKSTLRFVNASVDEDREKEKSKKKFGAQV